MFAQATVAHLSVHNATQMLDFIQLIPQLAFPKWSKCSSVLGRHSIAPVYMLAVTSGIFV